MRIVDVEERLPELRRLGLSRAILRLAAGEHRPHPYVRFREPYKVYRGMRWERGPLFVPLWENEDVTTAVRRKGEGLEFFAFDVEAPARRWTLARSEQGLLATVFFTPLNLLYDDPEESGPAAHKALAAAARLVGFRFYKQADGVFRDHYARGYTAFRRAYTKLIRDIDSGAV